MARFPQTVTPVGAGNARVVNGAGDDLKSLVVEFEVIAVGAKEMLSGRRRRLRIHGPEGGRKGKRH
jgi:hypothetical protein